jgi:hypothetical protein
MPTPKAPKDPQEDREPQRREDFGVEEEADIEESKAPMAHAEVDDEELAEADLEELSEDDLKDMEGPDA